MLISIIVPVYKVEDYLAICIESILNQTFDGQHEIILVDDGSPDHCPNICDKYCEQYQRVSVVHQDNQGLSCARNTGMRTAKGEYLLFVDSDDILLPGAISMIESIISSNPTTEAFFFSYQEIKNNCLFDEIKGGVVGIQNGNYSVTSVSAQKFVSDCSELWPAWRIIPKKKFVERSGLEFASGLIHEDVDWTARVLLSARIIGIYNIPIIGYRVTRVGSITETFGYKNFDHIFTIVNKLMEDMTISTNEGIKISLRERLSQTCFSKLRAWKKANKTEKELICKRINKEIRLLQYSRIITHILFYRTVRIVGASIAMRLYNLLYK